jgi:hypothetical protein
MTQINCRLCQSNVKHLFTEMILSKYLVKYFICNECEGIQVESPFWLNESYDESINLSDTGILSRNFRLMKLVTIFIFLFDNKNSKYLDYGGGYGVFTRLMRDVGLDYYWEDLYTKNYFSRGFEGVSLNYRLATCFEVLEHAVNPSEIFDYLLSKVDVIIFTTLLYGDKPPNKKEWSYYAFSHGQHIFFYNIKTLEYLARKYNLNLISDKKDFHILSKKKIPAISIFTTKVFYKLGLFSFINKLIKSKTMNDSNLMKRSE